MQAAEIFRLIVFAGMLCWATYTDLYQQRIPNILSLAGTVLGFALAIGMAANPADGFIYSLGGFVAGAGPFLLFYLIGKGIRKPLMSAGDVKLMGAIGTFVGAEGALWCIYYGMMVAGVFALGVVLFCFVSRRKVPKMIALGACLAVGSLFWLARHEGQLEGPALPQTEAAIGT